MFIVNVHTGGRTLHGPSGVYYSQGPTTNFAADGNITLNELKCMIYNHLGIAHEGNELQIRVRYNAAIPPNAVYYHELQIVDENTWTVVKQSLQYWTLIDLYVDIISIVGSDRPGPSSSRRSRRGATTTSRRQSVDTNRFHEPQPEPQQPCYPQETFVQPQPQFEPQQYFQQEAPHEPQFFEQPEHEYEPQNENEPQDEVEPTSFDDDELEDYRMLREFNQIFLEEGLNPRERICTNILSNDIEFTDLNANENLENDEELIDVLGIDPDNEIPDDNNDGSEHETSHQLYWQLAGRSESHPVPSFNTIDEITQILGDGSFFPNETYTTDNQLEEGCLFRSKEHLKWMVHDHHIRINRTFKMSKSNKTVYTIVCTDQNCKWRLYASTRPQDGSFVIKKRSGPHTCVSIVDRQDHPHLTSPFIATIIRHHIAENPRYPLGNIKVTIQDMYNFTPKYLKCWRAKEIAISHLFGGWYESYNLIGPLLNAIQSKNVGTKVEWFNIPTLDPNVMKFQMVIWAFGPAISSFPFCRPLIGIDGTFLTGKYKGKLLTCVGFDAEDHLVPLAFALCDQENNRTWERFMRFVRQHVVGSRHVCVISDRHKSILRVFKEPDLGWNVEKGEAVHRYCSRHVCQNFHSKFRTKSLIPFIKKVFRQNQPHKFQARLELLENKKEGSKKWLYELGSDDAEHPQLELWSPVHDGGYRWGMMTTNGPESLNNVFREARALPVTALIEVTFYKSVKYFAERREKAATAFSNNALFAPRVQDILEKRRLKGNQHTVHPFAMRQKYEVRTPRRLEGNTYKGGRKQRVTFNQGQVTCSCQKPQLTGIPCSHVMSVCADQGIDSNQYVNGYYSITALCQTWLPQFELFGNPEQWPTYSGPNLIPDPIMYKPAKGRRKTMRIRSDMDVISQQPKNAYNCGKCGQSGHSRRTCPNQNEEHN